MNAILLLVMWNQKEKTGYYHCQRFDTSLAVLLRPVALRLRVKVFLDRYTVAFVQLPSLKNNDGDGYENVT